MNELKKLGFSDDSPAASLYLLSLHDNKKEALNMISNKKHTWLLPYMQAFEIGMYDGVDIRSIGQSMGILVQRDSDDAPMDIFVDKVVGVIKTARNKEGKVKTIIRMNEDDFNDYLLKKKQKVKEFDYRDRLYQLAGNNLM